MTEQAPKLVVESIATTDPETGVVTETPIDIRREETVAESDTVSVEEINGTKEAVVNDLAAALMAEAPGGEYARMDERAQARLIAATRNRQITNWMKSNFTSADVLLESTAHALRDLIAKVISESTPEQFRDHVISKLIKGDAFEMSWEHGGLMIHDITLSWNQTTSLPVVKKRTPIFAKGVAMRLPKVHEFLVSSGVNIHLDEPRIPETPRVKVNTNLKSIIISVGQCVELYMTRPATIMRFKSAPSTGMALKPLDILNTFKPTGFNGMLKEMSDRKLVAMGRREWFDWQEAGKEANPKPVIDVTKNPLYGVGTQQTDNVPVAVAGDDLPW